MTTLRKIVGFTAATLIAFSAAQTNAASFLLVQTADSEILEAADIGANDNDVLDDNHTLMDVFDAQIRDVGGTGPQFRIDYYFLGSESGFRNTLTDPASPEHTEPADSAQTIAAALLAGPVASDTVARTGNRTDFTINFKSTGFPGILSDGEVEGGSDDSRSLAFAFLDITSAACTDNLLSDNATLGCSLSASQALIDANSPGNGYFAANSATYSALLITLDDGGADEDDNHDDYVGFATITVVPVPAAVWFFGTALLGLAAFNARKQR